MNKGLLAIVGGIGGVVMGSITRPSVLGFQIPIDVLFSAHPTDAGAKQMLITHYAMWVIGAAVVGFIIGAILEAASANTGTTSNPGANSAREKSKAYDASKWAALKEVDPEIKEAADQVSALGPRFEDELATKYLAISDKTYLPAIVKAVAEKAAKADAGDTPKTSPLPRGENWRTLDSGFIVVTGGKHVGKVFSSYEEMLEGTR